MKQTNSITKYAALTALVVMAASSIGCDKIQLPNGKKVKCQDHGIETEHPTQTIVCPSEDNPIKKSILEATVKYVGYVKEMGLPTETEVIACEDPIVPPKETGKLYTSVTVYLTPTDKTLPERVCILKHLESKNEIDILIGSINKEDKVQVQTIEPVGKAEIGYDTHTVYKILGTIDYCLPSSIVKISEVEKQTDK
ncbi:hypothetical protein HOK51_11545 [Candidatus Woesearchaeota archaeon]|jgi:hypothetical protein|nr:hypothetical protein [Candidatus Woesearchaeota archaeon]MBT6520455.1 hypothetical protein [Candidatus Woesearchaeota archaeon]MBT7367349.1 hypothetical protein [Candidatus Woesearchaeota archaeon]